MKPTLRDYRKIPTQKLKEILDSNHCTGIDGADYFPIKELLESEYYKRLELQSQSDLYDFEKQQKEQFKATYKRSK